MYNRKKVTRVEQKFHFPHFVLRPNIPGRQTKGAYAKMSTHLTPSEVYTCDEVESHFYLEQITYCLRVLKYCNASHLEPLVESCSKSDVPLSIFGISITPGFFTVCVSYLSAGTLAVLSRLIAESEPEN